MTATPHSAEDIFAPARETFHDPDATVPRLYAAAAALWHSPHPDDRLIARRWVSERQALSEARAALDALDTGGADLTWGKPHGAEVHADRRSGLPVVALVLIAVAPGLIGFAVTAAGWLW